MPGDLKFDADTGDLVLHNNRDLVLVGEPEATHQRLQTRIRRVRGDWLYDDKGIPYFDVVFTKEPRIAEVDGLFRAEIADVQGITRVAKYESTFDASERSYRADFVADAEFARFDGEFALISDEVLVSINTI